MKCDEEQGPEEYGYLGIEDSKLRAYHEITHHFLSTPPFHLAHANPPFRMLSEDALLICYSSTSPCHLLAYLSMQVAVLILRKGLPIQQQFPPGGLVQILQQGSHSALPRPIGSHQRCNLSRTQGERQPLKVNESHSKRQLEASNLETVIVSLYSITSYRRDKRRKMETKGATSTSHMHRLLE
jgi:hypothetical protein